MAAGRVLASPPRSGSDLTWFSVCCLPKDGPGGSPAAAPFLEPRREGSRAPLLEMRSCKYGSPKIGQGRNGSGLHPLKLARLGRAPREGSSLHLLWPGATKIQLQIS